VERIPLFRRARMVRAAVAAVAVVVVAGAGTALALTSQHKVPTPTTDPDLARILASADGTGLDVGQADALEEALAVAVVIVAFPAADHHGANHPTADDPTADHPSTGSLSLPAEGDPC
jgi:hypothetical protein